MQYQSDYYPVAQSYLPLFHQKGEKFFVALCACDVPLQVMELVYESLVRQRRIGAVETMYQHDKEILWEMAKEYADKSEKQHLGYRLGKVGMMRLVKAIVLVEYFLNIEEAN